MVVERPAANPLPEVRLDEKAAEERPEPVRPAASPAPVASSIEPAFSDDDIDIPEFLK